MSINKPIIDAGPTTQRRHVLNQPVNVVPLFDPSLSNPEYEGQITVSTFRIYDGAGEAVSEDNDLQLAEMYVGVDISGTLTWVKCTFSRYIDGYTGEEFDPMFGV